MLGIGTANDWPKPVEPNPKNFDLPIFATKDHPIVICPPVVLRRYDGEQVIVLIEQFVGMWSCNVPPPSSWMYRAFSRGRMGGKQLPRVPCEAAATVGWI